MDTTKYNPIPKQKILQENNITILEKLKQLDTRMTDLNKRMDQNINYLDIANQKVYYWSKKDPVIPNYFPQVGKFKHFR